jgi:hypothetical protein
VNNDEFTNYGIPLKVIKLSLVQSEQSIMNTRILMTISALIMGAAGILLSFLPHEILRYVSVTDTDAVPAVALQVLGALYFAFAMMNWTARANLIGGIYGRPIAIGNLAHFVIGTLALMKAYFVSENITILVSGLFYSAFAVSFGIVFYTHPVARETTS